MAFSYRKEQLFLKKLKIWIGPQHSNYSNSDEGYPPSTILNHLEEWKEDWMFDEYPKLDSDRIPLPLPPNAYFENIERLKSNMEEMSLVEKEEERELERSLSPLDGERKQRNDKLDIEKFRIVEGGLAEWPNCARTFFPDRLVVHLKSCKPGKPLIPKGMKSKRQGYVLRKRSNFISWHFPELYKCC
jgi:hypothetical protein